MFCVLSEFAAAQSPTPPQPQTEEDDYTRYELLALETAQFKIVYDVTATTPDARFYFNPIRKGSVATDEAVWDLMTNEQLKFEVVKGADARASGHLTADLDTEYVKVSLPRAVPLDGEVRLRIDKTYKDPKSYFREGDLIVFSRSLGIKRNAVVLPRGYELVACNMPSQVQTESDGRIAVSFFNINPEAVSLVVKGRRLRGAPPVNGLVRETTLEHMPGATPAETTLKATPARLPRWGPRQGRATGSIPVSSPAPDRPLGSRTFGERAKQDREIVYFLKSPETHAFELYHDYTESREGVSSYLNVVRQGSTVSNPSARVLDTGEALKTETLKGDAITGAGLDIGEPVRADSEVVVIRFPAVKKDRSVRLRITETYTDPNRYALVGSDLVWERRLGRPRNAVVLPEGWYLVESSVPTAVTELPDQRIRLDYLNPRLDELDVTIRARRRR